MKNLARLSCVLSIVLFCAAHVRGQEIAGSIRGRVLDASGGVVTDAKVTVRNVETGFERVAISNSQGAYLLVELPVGHYRLTAEAKGFQKYVQEGISLDVNQSAAVAIHLAVGTTSEEIHVHADAALVDTAASSLGKTVGERDVVDLPLNGRNFSQLGLLQPGVVPITPGLLQAGSSLRNEQAYAVNGQRPESNNFLIDGANNFNAVDGGLVIQLPIDSISEFRILTSTASAEFGHSSGSTTNIITRSGTNSYHGALWEFLRNDAMDAKSFFATSVEPLKRNQFGGTFGGPLRRDKTFFFGYYEGLRNRQGETTSATVPSQLEQQGDFGQLCVQNNGQFNSNGICIDNQTQQPSQNGQLINEFSGQPFPFNKLPFINPIAQNLLPFFPLPNDSNLGPNAYIATQSLSQNNDQFGMRVDHYLTSRDVLNFRYMFSQGATTDPLSTAGANVPGFPVGENQRAQNFVAQETHTFSSALTAVARLSFLRNKFLYDEHLNHTTPASLGFTYSPSLAASIGPPFVQVGGYASVGDPITGPRNTYDDAIDLSGSVTWIRGHHEMKFGGGYGHDHINVLFGIATNGFFVFSTFPVNDGFASFLFGQPVVFLQGGGDLHRGLNGNNVNAYAQDSYKINSRLTLNFGLRYEVPFPYTEIRNRQNLFEPGVQSKVFPSAPTGLLYPGDPGVPAGLIPTENALAPRVGFAWDPTGKAEWVVSAAYGIFYDPYYNGEGGPLQTPISAPPFLQTPQVQLPNFADPFNGTNPFNQSFSHPMTLLTVDKNLRLPYAQDWNLRIQRSFVGNWLLEASYVGTKGTRLPRLIEGNPTVYDPNLTFAQNTQLSDQRRLFSGCTVQAPSPCTFSSVGLISGIADSTYHALQTSLRRRFGHGLSFLLSYTLSKTLDDASSFNITGSASQSVSGENDLAQNPFDVNAEHGRSMFDARHRFVGSYEWALPWFSHPQNWYEHVLGNWQVNGITTAMSNTPFTVYDSSNPSAQGGAPEISGFFSSRPNQIGNPNSGMCPQRGSTPSAPVRTVQCWFNTSAFQQASAGQFGNVGRNTLDGPPYQQWDFSAFKNIPLHESKSLQFRAEFFNTFNHPNFRLPNNDINSPSTFGEITEALPGRLIQVALKFLF